MTRAFEDDFSIGDGCGVDVEMDHRIVTFEILLQLRIDDVVKFFIVSVSEPRAQGLGHLDGNFAPLRIADLFEVEQESRDITVDEGGGEFHRQALGKVQGTGFPALGRRDAIFESFEKLTLRFWNRAGRVAAGDKERGHNVSLCENDEIRNLK